MVLGPCTAIVGGANLATRLETGAWGSELETCILVPDDHEYLAWRISCRVKAAEDYLYEEMNECHVGMEVNVAEETYMILGDAGKHGGHSQR